MGVESHSKTEEKSRVRVYVVGFILIVGTILGSLIGYFSSAVPSRQDDMVVLPRDDAPSGAPVENPLVGASMRQSQMQMEPQNQQPQPETQVMQSAKDLDTLSLQEQIKKLKELLREKELTIAELNEKISKMGTPGIKDTLRKLPKMVPIIVGECVDYRVGSWQMPKECSSDIAKKSKEIMAKEPNILVWEIVPRVDTIPYKGLSPELKQHGLGVFRVESLKRVLKKELGGELFLFQSGVKQEPNKRGLLLKAYKLEY